MKVTSQIFLAHLFDAHALAGEDDAEIDLLPIEADAAGVVATVRSWKG